MSRVRRIPVGTLANGGEIAIHLHEIAGELGAGPTVGICAGIHGNERTGTEIVLELARRYAEGRFRGNVVLLPVADPPAFAANQRHTPVDHINLNRVFPGDPRGWFSEQLAEAITKEFLNRVDALVDLHSGGDRPTVDYIYIRNAEELSRAFGSRVLYRQTEGKEGTIFSGTSVGVAESRGIPSVTVELGGGLIDQKPYVERGVRGVTNVLARLGMIDDVFVRPPEQLVVGSIVTIRPRMGGFLETEAPPLGETIEEGAVLGRVVSPYTFEELEVIRNPVPRGIMILSHLTRNVVEPGDYGYMVGETI
ncbi:MAG: succinylglutamate desuccinylase/aspartoacylase family protein [Vicinamibacteria bacterium]